MDKTNTQNNIFGFGGKGVKANINLSLNYYFSPKFRLNINSSVNYLWENLQKNGSISFYNDPYIAYNGFGSKYLKKSNSLSSDVSISLIYNIF
jgi:hypothetical protein